MNALPRKLNLDEWDGRYAQLRRDGRKIVVVEERRLSLQVTLLFIQGYDFEAPPAARQAHQGRRRAAKAPVRVEDEGLIHLVRLLDLYVDLSDANVDWLAESARACRQRGISVPRLPCGARLPRNALASNLVGMSASTTDTAARHAVLFGPGRVRRR